MINHKCIIIILITLLQGCQLFEADRRSYSESGIADEGLLINFREHQKDSKDSDPELFLDLQTKEIFKCANYRIDYKKRSKDTSIEIRLLGIDIGPFCLTAFGPAYAHISFPDVAGKMELVIMDGDLRDRFEIYITDTRVDITPIDVSFTETGRTRYYRKP